MSALVCRCDSPLIEDGWCVRCRYPWDPSRTVHYPSEGERSDPHRKASIARDRTVHYLDSSDDPARDAKLCPVCLRRFVPARADTVCCSAHCRRVKHRLDRGDETAAATRAWLRKPGVCEGCGERLWGKRVGARFHGDGCRKRAQRRAGRGAVR